MEILQSRASLTEKIAGRRDECRDGLLFPPEQDQIEQASCQVVGFLKKFGKTKGAYENSLGKEDQARCPTVVVVGK